MSAILPIANASIPKWHKNPCDSTLITVLIVMAFVELKKVCDYGNTHTLTCIYRVNVLFVIQYVIITESTRYV